MRAHMAFLSHDLLEGRAPGTRGYDLAAHYVATELEKLGVAPGGDAGNYFQKLEILNAQRTYPGIVPERAATQACRDLREQLQRSRPRCRVF